MENIDYNKEIIESMINFYNDPYKGFGYVESKLIEDLKYHKIPELLKGKYGCEDIITITTSFYISPARYLVVNDNYKKMCDKMGIDIEKLLEENNIPTCLHEAYVSCYFIALKDKKRIYSKIDLEGSLEYGLKDNIVVQEVDDYYLDRSAFSNSTLLRLIHEGEIITCKFEENELVKYKKEEVKGKIITLDYELLTYLNNSIYVEGERVYTDKKRIKSVEDLDTNKNRINDIVDVISGMALLITFEDDTCRVFIMDFDKKATTKYFKKLELYQAFIEKEDGYIEDDIPYTYPSTGLTFNYETDTECGELLIEDDHPNKQYIITKRYINNK